MTSSTDRRTAGTPTAGPTRSDLMPLFRPRAVALVGASDDPFKIGGRPLRYMTDSRSPVPIYPVNPTRDEVQGHKAYPSIEAIPDTVDQVILAVPAARAEAAVADGLAAGVRSFVMFTAGFAEAGDEGVEAQARLVETIRAGGARLLGPNAMGLLNFADRVFSSFSSAMDRGELTVGRVGVVSQSGAVGSYIHNLLTRRGIALSKFVATGNEADVEASECVEFMAGDPDCDVLVVYLETGRDGPGLMRALDTARRNGKPVVVLKAGRTDAGQAVATSHTGAMAGSAAVFSAVLEASGALVARSLPELVEMTYACAFGLIPRDHSLAMVTVSGGAGVMAADAAVEAGMPMPPLPEEGFAKVRELLPLAVGRNPLDTTAATIGDRTLFMRAVETMLQGRDYGSVMLFMANAGMNMRDIEAMRPALEGFRAKYPETNFAICTQSTPENAKEIEKTGFMVFLDPEACVKALAAVSRLRAVFEDRAAAEALPAPVDLPDRMDEATAGRLLAEAGIPMARTGTAADADGAVRLAEEIGWPVVLKVLSADIAHKSEVGGVKVGLADEAAVRAAFDEVTGNARRAAPGADIAGVTVSRMVQGGVQVILGAHRDPTFGPMVMVGLGGIFTEIMKDTAMRPAPVGEPEALEMIRGLKGFPLLDGARGQAKADVGALARAVAALSRFAAAQGAALEGAEINPMIVLPEGCVGVDALVVPAS